MMSAVIKELCVLTIVFGAVVSLAPEGGVKRIMEIACSAALVLSLLTPLTRFDFETYALELAKYREKEAELTLERDEASRRLSRLVIEQEYEAYISHKAEELGIVLITAEVEAKWSGEGLWTPEEVSLEGEYTQEQKRELIKLITTELGIPADRQHWSENERD